MSQQTLPRQHAEIAQPVFIAVVWTLFSTGTLFVIARIGIKLRTFKRLTWDDILVIFSWTMLLTTAILWQYHLHMIYENYEAIRGERPFDLNAMHAWGSFMKLIVPLNVLFYTGLWSVKISFLVFFKSFGQKIRSYEIHWWVVLVVTIAAYAGCIGDIQYQCTVPEKTVEFVLVSCATQSSVDWVNRTFYANCALDLLTDIMILSIPIVILWNAGVTSRKKIILCCIFSATVAIMAVALIRVTVVNSRHTNVDIAWLYFWTYVENAIAIMIACVASFRQLFVASTDVHSGSSGTAKKVSSINVLQILRGHSRIPSHTTDGHEVNTSMPPVKHSIKGKWADSQADLVPLDFLTVHQMNTASLE